MPSKRIENQEVDHHLVSHNGDSPGNSAQEFATPHLIHAPWTGEEEADFQQLKSPIAFRPQKSTTPNDSKVLVRKPRKQEYVRVHPDPHYRSTYAIIQDERNREALYVLAPDLYTSLEGEYRIHLIVTAMSNVEREIFLWPVPLAEADGRTYEWWDSALEMVSDAERAWIRIKTSRTRYERVFPHIPIEDPIWPETSFGELFSRGFKGKVISSLDHPFVRRIHGGQ
jgi:hypothetical protein